MKWTIAILGLFAYVVWRGWRMFVSVYFSPLAKFPGPAAAAATHLWKAYIELGKKESMCERAAVLHETYGDIVRVGPQEQFNRGEFQLHFSRPSVYHEIYNNNNRWDKEESFYRSFAVDESSFGYPTFAEASKRKAILAPLFARRRITNMGTLIQDNMDTLCDALKEQSNAGVSSDLLRAFRAFTVDTITSFCFNKSVDAIKAPRFEAPIVEAMTASIRSQLLFKHFTAVRWMVLNLPPWFGARLSPQTLGLIQLQALLLKQVKDVCANPKILENSPHPIIYHQLLDPEAHKDHAVPSPKSLCEEAQTLVFAGTDTVGNALMIGAFHIANNPDISKALKEELLEAWPVLQDVPRYEDLEKLPYLAAVVKEALRITPGVPTALPRVVPKSGATISGHFIPGGTVVGISSQFLHMNEGIFCDANRFMPDRWLQPDSKSLESWLVPFSKGPRACIGINLAYCELYLGFANIFRRFDLELDGTEISDLTWRECFLPQYTGRNLRAFCVPVTK